MLDLNADFCPSKRLLAQVGDRCVTNGNREFQSAVEYRHGNDLELVYLLSVRIFNSRRDLSLFRSHKMMRVS